MWNCVFPIRFLWMRVKRAIVLLVLLAAVASVTLAALAIFHAEHAAKWLSPLSNGGGSSSSLGKKQGILSEDGRLLRAERNRGNNNPSHFFKQKCQ